MDDDLDDYKLDTIWHQDPSHVVHISFEGDRHHRGRKVRFENKWYRQRELGVGSCGSVHLENTEDGRERAVKSIQKSLAERLKIDYRRELAALSTFSKARYQQHQVFVEFIGWFENPEFIFLAMEYLPLGDLSKHILEEVQEHDLKDISSQLLEGLKLMHSKGFAHRDLKPQNIFIVQIQPSWWVKIGDFGISKRVRDCDATELRTVTGTQGYEAPEIRGYVEVDEQNPSSAYTNIVDIWSLGCVIYQIVAKQVPFQNGRDIGRFCDGRISFPAQPLQGKLTTDGIEFLITILVASPAARPTADVALQHLWLVPDDDYIESFPRLENEAAKEEKLSACQEPSKSIQIRPDYHCEGQESVQPLGDKIQQLSREPGNQIIRAVDVEGGRSPDPARYLIPAIELFLRTLKPERDRSGERERSLERKASLELISNRTIGESIAASTYTAVGLSRPVNVEKEEAIYLNDRGRSAYMAQNFASAIDYHTKALSLFPTDPTILCNRAAAYYRLGDYDNALPDADAAVLSGGPHLALGWYWLGTTLYKRGDRKGSMDAYQMCIKCEGQNELRIWVQEWLTELEAEKDNEDKDYGTRGHDRTITCGSRGATLPVLKRKPEYHDIVPKHNDATGNIIAGIGSNNVPRRGFKGGRRGLLNHEMTKKASNMRSIPSCAACYITQVVVSQSYD